MRLRKGGRLVGELHAAGRNIPVVRRKALDTRWGQRVRVIIISEKRLGELFELALARISKNVEDPQSWDAKVSGGSVVYHLQELKAAIRDGEL